MDMQDRAGQIDNSALRTNQAFVIGLLLTAFVFDNTALVAFVCLVMVLGRVIPRFSLFKQIYGRILRPAGLVKPDVVIDNPEPHRFAQGFGAMVLALAIFFAARQRTRVVSGLACHLVSWAKFVPWFLHWLFYVLPAKPA